MPFAFRCIDRISGRLHRASTVARERAVTAYRGYRKKLSNDGIAVVLRCISAGQVQNSLNANEEPDSENEGLVTRSTGPCPRR